MKVLVTDSGRSGSWRIRGEQLGAAIGATVESLAERVKGYDVAVVVKRPPADLVARLHRCGIPLVWDVVDAWPQPDGNDWTESACRSWLAERVAILKPAAIVAATQAMAADCSGFGVPVLALVHHGRPGQPVNLIRETVRHVGYEGGEQYLGHWRHRLEQACARRGWQFHVKPDRLADLDIVVALRDQQGYAPRHWKSNVKLANAQATGTPFIGCREAGYVETMSGAECWADTPGELDMELDVLAEYPTRVAAAITMRAAAPTLEGVAADYRQWLETLCR